MPDLLAAPLSRAALGREDSAPELRVLARPRGHDLVLFTAVAGLVVLGIVMGFLVFIKHKDNIQRLLQGTENKQGVS